MGAKSVLIVAPPEANLLDVSGPWEVFCRVDRYAPGTYLPYIVSATPERRVITSFGVEILCSHVAAEFEGPIDTVLVVGSQEGATGRASPEFLRWLAEAAGRVRRIGSVCTGAFYLGHAGLLVDRRATTHWHFLDRLAKQFPEAKVEAAPIFTADRGLYTSAGITAGIDLSLALVEEDCGHQVAQTIARELVLFVQRQPGQIERNKT